MKEEPYKSLTKDERSSMKELRYYNHKSRRRWHRGYCGCKGLYKIS